MTNLRLLASQIVSEILAGKSLARSSQLLEIKNSKDRAFVQALCFGISRYYFWLRASAQFLIKKPLPKKHNDVYALILVGLYQLEFMRVPQHAAVSETVTAAKKIKKKSWAAGFVNAILQQYIRQKKAITTAIQGEEALLNHPQWWIEKLKKSWPKNWRSILEASNTHPPFSLRVNLQAIAREAYLNHLKQQDDTLQAKIIPETNTGIILKNPVPVKELYGFKDGKVWVQDGAAQLAAPLLQLCEGQTVLDACAAPGGKLLHILETEPKLAELTALEKDPARFKLLKQNLSKNALYQQCHCICHDVNEVKEWWDGRFYDRILLDAPCSGSGVVRRHPDIKLLRRSADIPAYAAEQLQLLKNLWPLLKYEGLFLYVTCSIFPEENVLVMKEFLNETPDAGEIKIKANFGSPCEIGLQILPGTHDMDGFYYALLRKREIPKNKV